MGGYHLLFTALQVCSGVLSTSSLTQTYCWCKSHSSHTPLLPSRHEYLNKYTYIPRCLTLSRILLLAWSNVWIMPLSQEVRLWTFSFTSSVYPDTFCTLWWHIRWENIQNTFFMHLMFFSLCEVTGDTELTGCIHANASLLTDRWHTSRPICSFTSTIKIHGSIFHCPVCQRCSVFFSVKWIKWAGCQKALLIPHTRYSSVSASVCMDRNLECVRTLPAADSKRWILVSELCAVTSIFTGQAVLMSW